MIPVIGMLVLAVALAGGWVGDPVWAQSAPGVPKGSKNAAQSAAPARPGPGDPSARPKKDDKRAPVTVDADHLENLQRDGLVIFTGNVVARQNNSTQWADRMEVYLDAKGDRIVRAVSTGNVKILTRDCRSGTAHRAEYYDDEQRVVLIGNARVWREDNVVTGERITMYLAEDRAVVESGSGGRVRGVFYPRGQEPQKPEPKREPGVCG
ncbi:MAG TPA: lipopolysaccharide transport periplasmic protein LptA [Methylomirabilota bacterium]|nr:lipopolysaccharide transport periplasmic protein LptA [Methylomirabilota bacterium]